MDSRSDILLAVIFAAMLPALLHAQTTTDKVSGIPPEALKLFEDKCTLSTNPKACVAKLSQNPNATSATTMKDVAKIAAAAVVEISNKALEIIRQAQAAPQSNPEATEDLGWCLKAFDRSVKGIRVNDTDIKMGMARENAADIYNAVESCKRHIDKKELILPALGDQIDQWIDLSNVYLSAFFDVVGAFDSERREKHKARKEAEKAAGKEAGH